MFKNVQQKKMDNTPFQTVANNSVTPPLQKCVGLPFAARARGGRTCHTFIHDRPLDG